MSRKRAAVAALFFNLDSGPILATFPCAGAVQLDENCFFRGPLHRQGQRFSAAWFALMELRPAQLQLVGTSY